MCEGRVGEVNVETLVTKSEQHCICESITVFLLMCAAHDLTLSYKNNIKYM